MTCCCTFVHAWMQLTCSWQCCPPALPLLLSVNAVMASAIEAAVAVRRRVDGAALMSVSPNLAYLCASAFGARGAARTCNTGWTFDDAINAMEAAPAAFFTSDACVNADLASLAYTGSQQQLARTCNRVKGSECAAPTYGCGAVALSDGLWATQRWLRTHGAVMTRLRVTADFKSFFASNRTDVYTNNATVNDDDGFWHAVLLIGEATAFSVTCRSAQAHSHALLLVSRSAGYDNTEFFWYARNSWGASWADGGTFRCAAGSAAGSECQHSLTTSLADRCAVATPGLRTVSWMSATQSRPTAWPATPPARMLRPSWHGRIPGRLCQTLQIPAAAASCTRRGHATPSAASLTTLGSASWNSSTPTCGAVCCLQRW